MILVILHELGHFWAAKASGVKVKEFWLGIPPKACTLWKDKSGTEYTLNRIPLGGFVSLKGEDWESEIESKDPDAFQNAKWRKKLIIIVAGVVMNLLTAFVIFTTIFTIGVKPMSILPEEVHGIKPESFLTPSISFLQQEGLLSGEVKDGPVIVAEVAPWSLAEKIGLLSWTQILAINDLPVSNFTLPTTLQKLSADTEQTMTILQNNQEKKLNFVCGSPCTLGIAYQQATQLDILPIKFPLPQAMLAALKEIKGERNMTMSALGNIGKKLVSFESNAGKEALGQLTGPVWAIKFGEKLLDTYGFLIFLGFAGMLSLALAFFNILPIPALDGGRFWFVIIQSVFKIKVEKFAIFEGRVNTIFFWAMMLFGVLIIFKDLIVFRGLKLPFFS